VVGASVAAPLVSVPAAVLVVAGVAKLRSPAAAGEALRAAGLPSGSVPARVVGAAEAAAGAAVLAAPSRPALVLAAALYAALAWFAMRLLRPAAEAASCGCFGADAPPSRVHVLFDAGAALLLAAAALAPPPGIPALAGRAPLAGAGLVVACATAAYAVTLVLAHLPAAAAAYRPRREAA
jgi:Methylamine utilisation protein MauE